MTKPHPQHPVSPQGQTPEAYSAPKLVRHGSVADLTRLLAGSDTEILAGSQ